MTFTIPHDVLVVVVAFVVVAGSLLLYGLFQIGHMDTSYRDQIRGWFEDWSENRARRKKKEN